MPYFDDRKKTQVQREDDSDLLDMRSLFVPLDDRGVPIVQDDADEDTSDVPQITKMPEGITVIEQQIGHAIGQWVFVMLCDCGRRWFSLKAQDKAQCPRCHRWVHVEADPNIPR